jgi:hypothetical protein
MPPKTPLSVDTFMLDLNHPQKELCNTVRNFIKSTDSSIQERIKWNAPSYYTSEDFLTFNFSRKETLLLIFHHPHIDTIQSDIFDSKPKGRAIMQLHNEDDFMNKAESIKQTIHSIVKHIEGK